MGDVRSRDTAGTVRPDTQDHGRDRQLQPCCLPGTSDPFRAAAGISQPGIPRGRRRVHGRECRRHRAICAMDHVVDEREGRRTDAWGEQGLRACDRRDHRMDHLDGLPDARCALRRRGVMAAARSGRALRAMCGRRQRGTPRPGRRLDASASGRMHEARPSEAGPVLAGLGLLSR